MTGILACIDQSAYGWSVCDHAAWFASRLDARVDVLHVLESGPEGEAAARRAGFGGAVDRLQDEGVERCSGRTTRGRLSAAAAALGPDLVVMGKRGVNSAEDRRTLGLKVSQVIEAVDAPVCLASKLFLPLRRALTILDADMDHRAAVEFVGSHPGMQDLDIDLIVAAQAGVDVSRKIAWARRELAGRDVAVFSAEVESFGSLVENLRGGTRRADMIIVSRAVLSDHIAADLRAFEELTMWGVAGSRADLLNPCWARNGVSTALFMVVCGRCAGLLHRLPGRAAHVLRCLLRKLVRHRTRPGLGPGRLCLLDHCVARDRQSGRSRNSTPSI